MPDAYVINKIIPSADKNSIDQLLVSSGFSPTYNAISISSRINISTDVAVVIMPIDKTENSAVTQEIANLGKIGVRIVGIWLLSASGSALPGSVKTYGYSAVCINSQHAEGALKGTTPAWENSNCLPREEQPIPRNKC